MRQCLQKHWIRYLHCSSIFLLILFINSWAKHISVQVGLHLVFLFPQSNTRHSLSYSNVYFGHLNAYSYVSGIFSGLIFPVLENDFDRLNADLIEFKAWLSCVLRDIAFVGWWRGHSLSIRPKAKTKSLELVYGWSTAHWYTKEFPLEGAQRSHRSPSTNLWNLRGYSFPSYFEPPNTSTLSHHLPTLRILFHE